MTGAQCLFEASHDDAATRRSTWTGINHVVEGIDNAAISNRWLSVGLAEPPLEQDLQNDVDFQQARSSSQ